MRRPATAVMFATTSGMVVPMPSGVERSTPNRLPTSEWLGTMNTSLYVRSCPGAVCSMRMGGVSLLAVCPGRISWPAGDR